MGGQTTVPPGELQQGGAFEIIFSRLWILAATQEDMLRQQAGMDEDD